MNWLVKLAIGLVLVGVVGFDAISLSLASVQVQGDAEDAARIGAMEYQAQRSSDPARAVDLAYDAAAQFAFEKGLDTSPDDFSIDTETGVVRIVVHRTAITLVAHRVGFLRDKTEITKSGTGGPGGQ